MNITPRHLLAAAAAASLAVAGVNCAPVDAPGPDDAKTTLPTTAAVPSTPAPAPMPPPTPLRDDGADALKARIDAAIDQVKHRDLLTTHGFWTVFHGILGLGPSVELLDPLSGKRVNALDYIADGGEIRGVRFLPSPDGLDVQSQPGSFVGQGHQDQFVAEMVEWNTPPDKKFLVNGVAYPFKDFPRFSRARASVTEKQELDYTVLIVSQYYGTDAVWTNSLGQTVHFEDLLRYQMDAPIDPASCGGTHRLFGLTWAYHLHLLRGGQTTGVWKELADWLAHYNETALQLQNADGSFSTSFFRGKGASPDAELRLNTTGHTLEWLALDGSDEELRSPKLRDAANALAVMILDSAGSPREGGTLYHAVHGLLLYRARVFGAADLGPNAPHVPLLPQPKENLPLPIPGAGPG